MYITGLGTAAPVQTYKQTEGWEAVQLAPQFSRLDARSRAILRKVLRGCNGIETRHLSLSSLHEVFETSPDILQERFTKHAPALATLAAKRALADAGVDAGEIDGLLISTCTGYLCPGLTSYVSERLGLRSDAILLDLVGQGCGAALPNLRTGHSLLASGQCDRVLSVCVEVCSAAFYLDDDPGVLISACLFGDAAGAAVLSPEPKASGRKVRWHSSHTTISAKDRDLLRFEHAGGMLRNVLSPQVPRLAAHYSEEVLNTALAKAGVARKKLATWIWHAGGRDVLLALQERFGLSAEDVRHSAAVLREYGNISSACVYFVLQSALAEGAPGGFWWMSSFGAGFSCHGALLEVE